MTDEVHPPPHDSICRGRRHAPGSWQHAAVLPSPPYPPIPTPGSHMPFPSQSPPHSHGSQSPNLVHLRTASLPPSHRRRNDWPGTEWQRPHPRAPHPTPLPVTVVGIGQGLVGKGSTADDAPGPAGRMDSYGIQGGRRSAGETRAGARPRQGNKVRKRCAARLLIWLIECQCASTAGGPFCWCLPAWWASD